MAVQRDPRTLVFITDWFLTQKQIDIWHQGDYYCNKPYIIGWHADYQKRKAEKVRIKKELMPLAWHQSRW